MSEMRSYSSLADVTWADVDLPDQGLAIEIPEGWEGSVDEGGATFFGDYDGDYRPSIIVRTGKAEQPGEAWFDEFTSGIAGMITQQVADVEVVETSRFNMAPLDAPLFRLLAHWPAYPPAVPATTQLHAWIWVSSERVVSFSATTDVAYEERDLPVFEHVLRSIYLEED